MTASFQDMLLHSPEDKKLLNRHLLSLTERPDF